MDSSSSSSGCVVVTIALLTVAFIVLKLTGVIDWSWVWVLAPIWISVIISVIVVFFEVVLIIAVLIISDLTD